MADIEDLGVDEEDDEQVRPGSPWWLVFFGVAISALGLLVASLDDVPSAGRAIGFCVVGIGGLLAQVGVISAGVEYGMRRVRGY